MFISRKLLKTLIKGRISQWGFCSKMCQDHRRGFMYANLNILNNKECQTLIVNINKKRESAIQWNKDWEICAGKKHEFPKTPITFHRYPKRKLKYKLPIV